MIEQSTNMPSGRQHTKTKSHGNSQNYQPHMHHNHQISHSNFQVSRVSVPNQASQALMERKSSMPSSMKIYGHNNQGGVVGPSNHVLDRYHNNSTSGLTASN